MSCASATMRRILAYTASASLSERLLRRRSLAPEQPLGEDAAPHLRLEGGLHALGIVGGGLHPFEKRQSGRFALGQVALEGVIEDASLALLDVQVAEAELLDRLADRAALAEVHVEHAHH